MLYEMYEQKLTKKYNFKVLLFKLRYLIITVSVVLVGLFTAFAVTKGNLKEEDIVISIPLSDEGKYVLNYGDSFDIEATAYFSDVKVQYLDKNTSTWTYNKPNKAGEYEFRFVTKKLFGEEYSDAYSITINQIELALEITSTSFVYGNDSTIRLKTIDYTSLADGDYFDYETTTYNHDFVTNVNTTNLSIDKLVIRNTSGEDVTSSYYITYPEEKEVTVLKRNVTLRVINNNLSKTYDGLIIDNNELLNNYTYDTLPYGDKLTYNNVLFITNPNNKNVNFYQYKLDKDSILINDSTDLLYFYNFSIDSSTYRISKKDITINTLSSDSHIYNAEEFSYAYFDDAVNNSLISGDHIEINSNTITKVKYACSNIDNVFSVSIFDSNNDNVSNNYNISYVYGKLGVQKRLFEYSSLSDEKVYDGLPLFNNNVNYNITLFDNEEVIVDSYKEIKYVSETSLNNNELSVHIYNSTLSNSENELLKNSYDYSQISKGSLTITKRSITLNNKVNSIDETYKASNFDAATYLSNFEVLENQSINCSALLLSDNISLESYFDTNVRNVDTYVLKVKLNDSLNRLSNYDVDDLPTITFNVNKKEITLELLSQEFTYKGDIQEFDNTNFNIYDTNSIIWNSSDELTINTLIEYDNNVNSTTIDYILHAGNYTASINSSNPLNGDNAYNYDVISCNDLDFIVNKYNINITADKCDDYIYDGSYYDKEISWITDKSLLGSDEIDSISIKYLIGLNEYQQVLHAGTYDIEITSVNNSNNEFLNNDYNFIFNTKINGLTIKQKELVIIPSINDLNYIYTSNDLLDDYDFTQYSIVTGSLCTPVDTNITDTLAVTCSCYDEYKTSNTTCINKGTYYIMIDSYIVSNDYLVKELKSTKVEVSPRSVDIIFTSNLSKKYSGTNTLFSDLLTIDSSCESTYTCYYDGLDSTSNKLLGTDTIVITDVLYDYTHDSANNIITNQVTTAKHAGIYDIYVKSYEFTSGNSDNYVINISKNDLDNNSYTYGTLTINKVDAVISAVSMDDLTNGYDAVNHKYNIKSYSVLVDNTYNYFLDSLNESLILDEDDCLFERFLDGFGSIVSESSEGYALNAGTYYITAKSYSNPSEYLENDYNISFASKDSNVTFNIPKRQVYIYPKEMSNITYNAEDYNYTDYGSLSSFYAKINGLNNIYDSRLLKESETLSLASVYFRYVNYSNGSSTNDYNDYNVLRNAGTYKVYATNIDYLNINSVVDNNYTFDCVTPSDAITVSSINVSKCIITILSKTQSSKIYKASSYSTVDDVSKYTAYINGNYNTPLDSCLLDGETSTFSISTLKYYLKTNNKFASTPTSAVNVGTYAVEVNEFDTDDLFKNNYSYSFNIPSSNQISIPTFEITKRSVVITPITKSDITYNACDYNYNSFNSSDDASMFTAEIDGYLDSYTNHLLKEDETLILNLDFIVDEVASSTIKHAGTYKLTAASNTFTSNNNAVLSNYDLTLSDTSVYWTINPADIYILPTDLDDVTYDGKYKYPTSNLFTAIDDSLNEYENHLFDSSEVLTLNLKFRFNSTIVDHAYHAGDYDIIVDSISYDTTNNNTKYIGNDYNFTYCEGSFTIDPLQITIVNDANGKDEYTYIFNNLNRVPSSLLDDYCVTSDNKIVSMKDDGTPDIIYVNSSIKKYVTNEYVASFDAKHAGLYILDGALSCDANTILSDYGIELIEVSVTINKRNVYVYGNSMTSIYYDGLNHSYISPATFNAKAYMDKDLDGVNESGYAESVSNAIPYSDSVLNPSFVFVTSINQSLVKNAGTYNIEFDDSLTDTSLFDEDFIFESNIGEELPTFTILKRPIKISPNSTSITFDSTYHQIDSDYPYTLTVYDEDEEEYISRGLYSTDVVKSISGHLEDTLNSYEKIIHVGTYDVLFDEVEISNNYDISLTTTNDSTYTISQYTLYVSAISNETVPYKNDEYKESDYPVNKDLLNDTTGRYEFINSTTLFEDNKYTSNICFIDSKDSTITYNAVKEVGTYYIGQNNISIIYTDKDNNKIDVTSDYDIHVLEDKEFIINCRDIYIDLLSQNLTYAGTNIEYKYNSTYQYSLNCPEDNKLSKDSVLNIVFKYTDEDGNSVTPINAGSYYLEIDYSKSSIMSGNANILDQYNLIVGNSLSYLQSISDPNALSLAAKLIISKKNVTITLPDLSYTYNGSEFTISSIESDVSKNTAISGLCDDDKISYIYKILVFDKLLNKLSDPCLHASDAGYSYFISPDTDSLNGYPNGYKFVVGSNDNYIVKYDQSSNLTINRLTVNVTPTSNYSREYNGLSFIGDDLNNFSFTIKNSNNEDVAFTEKNIFASSITTNATKNVGTYKVKAKAIGCSDSNYVANDYSFNYVQGSWKITARPITIDTNNISITYGDSTDIYLTNKTTDLVNRQFTLDSNSKSIIDGDYLLIKLKYLKDKVSCTPFHVGSYDIAISTITNNDLYKDKNDNYEITLKSSTLTINKFNVSLYLDNYNTYYGSDISKVSYKVKFDTISKLPHNDQFDNVIPTYSTLNPTSVGVYNANIPDLTKLVISSKVSKAETGLLSDYNITESSVNQGKLYINKVYAEVTFDDGKNTSLYTFNRKYQTPIYSFVYYYYANNLTTGTKNDISNNIKSLFDVTYSIGYTHTVNDTPVKETKVAHAGTYALSVDNLIVKKNNVVVTDSSSSFEIVTVGDAHYFNIKCYEIIFSVNSAYLTYDGIGLNASSSAYKFNNKLGNDVITGSTKLLDSTKTIELSKCYHAGTYYYMLSNILTVTSVTEDGFDVTSNASDYALKNYSDATKYGQIIIAKASVEIAMNFVDNNKSKTYDGLEVILDPVTDHYYINDTESNVYSNDTFNAAYKIEYYDELAKSYKTYTKPNMIDAYKYRISISNIYSINSTDNHSSLNDYDIKIQESSYSYYTINKLPITIKYIELSKTYDGLPMFDWTVTNTSDLVDLSDCVLGSGDEVFVSPSYSNIANETNVRRDTDKVTVLSYKYSVGIQIINKSDPSNEIVVTNNYAVSDNEGEYTINPMEINVKTSSYDITYEGISEGAKYQQFNLLDKDNNNIVLPTGEEFRINESLSLKLFENVVSQSKTTSANKFKNYLFLELYINNVKQNINTNNPTFTNYNLTYTYGDININKLTLYYEIVDNSKTYDGLSTLPTNLINVYSDELCTTLWSGSEVFSVSSSTIKQITKWVNSEEVEFIKNNAVALNSGKYEITINTISKTIVVASYPEMNLDNYITLVNTSLSNVSNYEINRYNLTLTTLDNPDPPLFASVTNPIVYKSYQLNNSTGYLTVINGAVNETKGLALPDTLISEPTFATSFIPYIDNDNNYITSVDNVLKIKIENSTKEDVTNNYNITSVYGKLRTTTTLDLAKADYFIYGTKTISRQIVDTEPRFVFEFNTNGVDVRYECDLAVKFNLSNTPLGIVTEIVGAGTYMFNIVKTTISLNGEVLPEDDLTITNKSYTISVGQREIAVKAKDFEFTFDNSTHIIENSYNNPIYEFVDFSTCTISKRPILSSTIYGTIYNTLADGDYMYVYFKNSSKIPTFNAGSYSLMIEYYEIRHMNKDPLTGEYDPNSYTVIADNHYDTTNDSYIVYYEYDMDNVNSNGYTNLRSLSKILNRLCEINTKQFSYLSSSTDPLKADARAKAFNKVLQTKWDASCKINRFKINISTGSSTVTYKQDNDLLNYNQLSDYKLENKNYTIFNATGVDNLGNYYFDINGERFTFTPITFKSIYTGSADNDITKFTLSSNSNTYDCTSSKGNFELSYTDGVSSTKGKLTITPLDIIINIDSHTGNDDVKIYVGEYGSSKYKTYTLEGSLAAGDTLTIKNYRVYTINSNPKNVVEVTEFDASTQYNTYEINLLSSDYVIKRTLTSGKTLTVTAGYNITVVSGYITIF